jgi:hypothetical protein
LKFDSDNELDDCALLDIVMSGESDENDNFIQDFVWENVNYYRGGRKMCYKIRNENCGHYQVVFQDRAYK